jgi:hypothetical protein
MRQHFALLYLGHAFLHFADEPFVVIYQALDGLSRQRFRVPALLRGKVSEPCLQDTRKTPIIAGVRATRRIQESSPKRPRLRAGVMVGVSAAPG